MISKAHWSKYAKSLCPPHPPSRSASFWKMFPPESRSSRKVGVSIKSAWPCPNCGLHEGPLFHFPAAVAFYRALRVYPAPTELLEIYQQTVAPPVFMLIVELMNHDVSQELLSVRGGAAKEDGIDDDLDTGTPASRSASRHGPPSETSSHEWDKLTDPGPPSVA